MGSLFSRVRRLFIGKRDVRILMNGLDAAGKTTILYKMKIGEVVTTIPTIGFNVETVEYRNVNFTVWDVGGRDKIRPLWRHYYQNTNALIWVVDSNDRERLDAEDYGSTKDELHRALAEDELRDAVLLVFANKQDLPNAMSTSEICQRLGLQSLRNRTWFIQGCCAPTGDGLYEGLDWLSEAIKRQKYTPSRLAPAPVIPVAAPVPARAIEPQPRKLGPLGVMDAISSANPNAFAVHALEKSAAPTAPVELQPIAAAKSFEVIIPAPANTALANRFLAAAPAAATSSLGTPSNHGVPRAPPLSSSLVSPMRYVAPRAPAAAVTSRISAAVPPSEARAPVSSRLFPSFPRTAEEERLMRSASADFSSLLKMQSESEPLSDLVVPVPATKLEDGEVSVVIEKRLQHEQSPAILTRRQRTPSFDVQHSPLVSLQVRYPLTQDDEAPAPRSRKRSTAADSEFVIVERIEEEANEEDAQETEMVVVQPGAENSRNQIKSVKLTMVEC